MGIFDGCLLACDIDGTLIENGYVNPKNVEMIEYFMREGGTFSLSTGRSIGAISDVLSKLKRVSASVVSNGCMIYDYANSKIIHDEVIPNKDYRIAKMVIDSPLNIGIEVHCGENVFTLARNRNTTMHQVYEKFEAPDVSFDDIKDKKWNKVLYCCLSVEDRNKLKELLKDEKTDCSFIDTCATLNGEFHNYYEQIPFGVSKATALEKLCKILNIKSGCLYAIGDYYNDIEMLKCADICAVTNTSPDEVKKYADYLTVSCSDGAVADFIEYLIRKD